MIDNTEKLIEEMMEGSALGALPLETKVVKDLEEEGDMTPKGTIGVIKGNRYIGIPPIQYAYLVQFENNSEDKLVFIIDTKIKKL